MKPLNPILLILILSFFSTIPCYSFFDKDIHRLNMQDGLADNRVSCIYKDRDEFMWFGTNNGLSRYDGKTIKNFSSGVAYMDVSYMDEISDSYLSVISEGVLYIFDRKTECFVPTFAPDGHTKVEIYGLLPETGKSFWGIIGNKLILYDWEKVQDEKGQLLFIKVHPKKEYKEMSSKEEPFTAFCYSPDRKSVNLVTKRGNLVLFRPESPSQYKKIKLGNFPSLNVSSILNFNGTIWVSTIAQGIIRYHLASGNIDRITYGGIGKEGLLSHTDVFQIVPINNDRYLAVTWSGYTLLIPDKVHKEELTTEIYNNTASQMYRSLETRMLSAYYDPNGVLWIGTNGGGVMYSDLRSQFFNQYHQERHNEICAIEMDSENHLWLATFHQGIMRSDAPFDPMKKLSFTTLKTGNINTSNTVLCVTKDSDHNLWFGNMDGTITSYHEKTKQFKIYSLVADNKQKAESIWAIYIDSNKRFWIGTDNGLFRFYPSSGRCEKIAIEPLLKNISKIYIRAISATRDGAIWLGTSNVGMIRIVEKKNRTFQVTYGYEQKAGVQATSVRSVLNSSDGYLYIGYTNGFALIAPQTDNIREFYTTHNGLCSNFVGCITEDNKGRIWLGSNSGVSRYSRHQHLFYNYYITGSNRSALYCNGFLFWGNNKSLTYFNPLDIDGCKSDDKVLITNLEVDNRPTLIGGEINGQVVLQEGVSYTDSIVLNHENRDFSLAFNNLSYSEEQQKYNYRLLPYQEHWLVSDGGEKASYTNLPEGKYTFEVKNIYPDGREGAITRLKIKILPHWSHTGWFRFLVLIVVSGGIAYLVRLIKRRQKRLEHEMQMKHELLTVSMEREKEHQIRIERENFFTGAAHELRTPLTLILSPLQDMLQQMDASNPLYNRLSVMYKNSSSLHTLVDHLLYVQKIEAGMVKLRLSETDIVELIREVCSAFVQIVELKGFYFEIKLPEQPFKLWIDIKKISSAVQNLLSNAFKYTSPSGTISLSVDKVVKDGKGYCRIVVSDTGIGISKDLQEHIFESFIIGDSTPGFSTKAGIGLRIVKNTVDLHHGVVVLDSEQRKGCTFTLLIPEGKEHFATDIYEVTDDVSHTDSKKIVFDEPVVNEEQPNPESKKYLLIVEDNLDVRKYIRSLFIHKYRVLEAENGEEGIQVAMSKLPDLIISDVMMPVKDGFTFCREVRANQETAHIPILMLTAKAEDVDVLQGSRSGADDYMMKPFNPEILKVKVENLILQREQLKRIYTKALMLKQEPVDGEKEDPFMQHIINIIEANLSDENLSVKTLASQLNMSQPTLYRKLKQHSKLAAVDIIRSIRISKAAALIMENRYSIQEISEIVGYNDVRTLRKHFTEQFGVSPSKYSISETVA